MAAPRLLVPGPLRPHTLMELDAERSNYLCRVLRRRRHDPVRLFDGQGCEYLGNIERADPRVAAVALGALHRAEQAPDVRLHLAQALIKGERFDWALQKATELGATHITPLITERTEVRLSGERRQRRTQHWAKVVEAACAQSERLWIPDLAPPVALAEFLAELPCPGVVLSPGAAPFNPPPKTDLVLVIGPEGGFSDTEQQKCVDAGLTPAGLGRMILRAETAPLAALAAIRSAWGWL